MPNSLTRRQRIKNTFIFIDPFFVRVFFTGALRPCEMIIVGWFNSADIITAVLSGSRVMRMITVLVASLTVGITAIIVGSIGEKISERQESASARV